MTEQTNFYQNTATPSLARWWRQVFFVPCLHNRWLTDTTKTELSQAIAQAEIGHRGEVFLVVENTLPLNVAYRHDSRDRAIQVFGDYRVWDTAENTGVLVYLNVCEHRLEIVADRGIHQYVMPETWQALCDKALDTITTHPIQALTELLVEIGKILREYHKTENDLHGNELSNEVVYLK